MASLSRAVSFALTTVGHAAFLWLLVGARPADREMVQEDQERRPLLARMIPEQAVARLPLSIVGYPVDLASEIAIEIAPPPQVEPVAADSFQRARAVTSSLDAAELERLQGTYRGQLLARLARIFEMQRATFRPAKGECVVNIVQSERGDVLDVITDLCGLPREQQAIIAEAIRSASPLPLPPAGLAMGSYLSLDLSAI